MKLYVDTGSKHVTVSRESVEKTEQNGRAPARSGLTPIGPVSGGRAVLRSL